MAFKSGNYTGMRPHLGLYTLIRNFVCGFPENNNPVFTPNTPRELSSLLRYFGEKADHVFSAGTWTLMCTTAVPGAAVFSVTHSVYAGPFADATEDVLYDVPEVTFKIDPDSLQEYEVGDTYTVTTTTVSNNDTPWILHVQNDDITSETYCQMEGPGLTDDQHINIIMRPYETAGRYLLGFRFARGYLSEATYNPANQPGVDSTSSFVAVESASDYRTFDLPFHLFCNKQRFIALLTAGNTQRSTYQGYFYPYGSPGQYSFPMYSGCEQTGSNHGWEDTDTFEVSSFVDPASDASRISLPGFAYDFVYHYRDDDNSTSRTYDGGSNQIWPFGTPYGRNFYLDLIEQTNGKYSMFPCTIRQNTSPAQILGELDGVCAIPGRNLLPGDIIENSLSEQFVVWKDTFRNNTWSFFAVRLA